MRTINEKLREARLKLGFSQDYVASCLGICRSAVTQIELGKRKVNSDELKEFCKLYHLSADYLLDTEKVDTNQAVFARNFNELNDDDQEEILNLIAFKRAMAKQQEGKIEELLGLAYDKAISVEAAAERAETKYNVSKSNFMEMLKNYKPDDELMQG